jgi:hypothetical protein
MATLEIKDKSIECQTTGYTSPKYKAYVGFETPETLEKEHRKQLTVELEANSRSDCTFEKVEREINEYINEHFSEVTIEKITSVQVKEVESIKSGFDLD